MVLKMEKNKNQIFIFGPENACVALFSNLVTSLLIRPDKVC